MNQTIELLSLLYELSLTNLKHLTPQETAKNFIRKFLSRKSLHAGSVWTIENYDEDAMILKKVYAIPDCPDGQSISMSQFSHAFHSQDMFISSKTLFKSEKEQAKYAYFKLGDFGLLELYHNGTSPIEFSMESFRPFLDVIAQFAVSLESGFSYQKLQSEMTQRKEAEKSLKTSEEKYKRIIDNIRLGLMEVDNDEVIQHANKPFLDLTGYRLDEIIGKNASDVFLDKEARETMSAQNESRQRGVSSSYEISLKDKNGEQKWAIISGAPNYDKKGTQIGTIGIHLDITEEKKLREENEFKNTQLKMLFEKSLDALVSINSDGEIFEWSPQATEIFEYTEKEILNKKLSETIIPYQQNGAHENVMKSYLNTGNAQVLNSRIEITGLKKSGKEFPIELTIFPLQFKKEKYFTAFIRDITEIKQSKANMEKALARQKELNNLKSQFVSMTSHELRTPLTTIRSNTELLSYQLENDETLTRKRLVKNVSRIDDNVDRLNQLINNILMIGKLDSDKVPFNPEPLNVDDYIREHILQDYQVRGQKITCFQEGSQRDVTLDKRLFVQIINNLLENAFKYSPEGSPPELHTTYHEDNLELKIKDYGIGIPEEEQEKLFDTFYRASNVGNIQGTGLGLAIVQQFVKLHEGSIKVSSKVGEGTIFTLNFPYL
ncbi:MAG: PAS domain-containing sensor histidine kinase [Bacteroidota bacterium]